MQNKDRRLEVKRRMKTTEEKMREIKDSRKYVWFRKSSKKSI